MVTLLPAEIDNARRAVVRQMMRRHRRDVDIDGEVSDLQSGVAALLRAECARLGYDAHTLSRVMGLSREWVAAALDGRAHTGLEWLVIIARIMGYRVTVRLEPVDARALHDLRALAAAIPEHKTAKLRHRVYKAAEDAVRASVRAGYRRQPVYPSIAGSGIAGAYAPGSASSSGSSVTVTSDADSSRSA